MKKIKIIKAINIQGEIDKWIKETNPIIESTSISSMVLQNGSVQNMISIVYEEIIKIDKNKFISVSNNTNSGPRINK